MTLHALVKNADDTILERRDFGAETPPHLAHKGLRWIPVNDTNPTHDPEIEIKTGPVITVLPAEVTRVWTVRAKTQLELDADADKAIDRDILGSKAFKSLALVVADAHSVTPAQMRDQLIAKYKTL